MHLHSSCSMWTLYMTLMMQLPKLPKFWDWLIMCQSDHVWNWCKHISGNEVSEDEILWYYILVYKRTSVISDSQWPLINERRPTVPLHLLLHFQHRNIVRKRPLSLTQQHYHNHHHHHHHRIKPPVHQRGSSGIHISKCTPTTEMQHLKRHPAKPFQWKIHQQLIIRQIMKS